MKKMTGILAILLVLFAALPCAAESTLPLMMQQRPSEEAAAAPLTQQCVDWDPAKTAIVICDMWDKHWCSGATRRVGQMVPTMEKTIQKAREMGILIIHAPSDTMDFYADTPQRKRAQDAPRAIAPREARREARKIKEGPLPIDDSDGGCNCTLQCTMGGPWKRQIDTLTIAPEDIITDDGREVYNLMRAQERENLILMGVHTNMCVLGRSFAIRQQVKNGLNVALMRDLTDTMYNARKAPFVDHFRGTELVVDHIEKYWCPTFMSSAFTQKAPFRFPGDKRPHAVFVIFEQEYDTKETVVAFAEKELAGALQWKCTYVMGTGEHNMPGLEVLADADLMFVSVRRQALPAAQLAHIRAYCKSGKPIVGIRTASHAFVLSSGEAPEGSAQWPAFDPEILGGHYAGHHNNKKRRDPKSYVWVSPEAVDHPIVKGLSKDEWKTTSWMYKVLPLADTAKPLMMGRVEGRRKQEPVAWTNTTKHSNRVFYTSLGHPDDFKDDRFRTLLLNGVRWAMGEAGETN